MAEWPQRRSNGDIGNRLEYATTDASRMHHLHSKAVQQIEHLLEADHMAGAGRTDYSNDDVVDLSYWELKHRGKVGAQRYMFELGDTTTSTTLLATDVATRAIVYVMRNRHNIVRETAVVSVRQTFDDYNGVFVNAYTLEAHAHGLHVGTVAHTRPDTQKPVDRHMTPYDFHQLDLQLGELAIMAGVPLALLGDREETV